MATFRVSAPDGSQWDVNAPDTASEDEVLRYAKSQWQKPKPAVEPKVEDPGFGMSALIAAGRQTDKLVKGVKQAGLNVASVFSDAAKNELDRMAQEEKQNDVYFERLQKIRPGATFLGETAPLLLAPVATGLGAAGVAASAALPGLLEYGTPEEKLTRGALGAIGGAAGYKVGEGVSRVFKPTPSLSEAQQKALDAADRLGVKLTAGEATGNRALKWAEAASSDIPVASGIAARRGAGNEQALATAAAKSVGQQANELSEGVLSSARQGISNEFRRILDPLQVNLNTKQFDSELSAVQNSKVLKSLRDESVDGLIAEMRDIAKSGAVDGAWFQQNKTALDQAIRAAYNNGQPGKAKSLELIDNALDRAAKQAMGQDASAYEAARKQWANLRILETGKVVDEGKVMPGRLKAAMENRYKSAFKEGKIQGELSDIAALANTLRPPPPVRNGSKTVLCRCWGSRGFG